MTNGKINSWYRWMRECHEFAAKLTAPSVQDGVQRRGAYVYCQNILPNQKCCDSGKSVPEESQQVTGTSKSCSEMSGAEI
jgi:hypothetical protein